MHAYVYVHIYVYQVYAYIGCVNEKALGVCSVYTDKTRTRYQNSY